MRRIALLFLPVTLALIGLAFPVASPAPATASVAGTPSAAEHPTADSARAGCPPVQYVPCENFAKISVRSPGTVKKRGRKASVSARPRVRSIGNVRRQGTVTTVCKNRGATVRNTLAYPRQQRIRLSVRKIGIWKCVSVFDAPGLRPTKDAWRFQVRRARG